MSRNVLLTFIKMLCEPKQDGHFIDWLLNTILEPNFRAPKCSKTCINGSNFEMHELIFGKNQVFIP